MPYDLFVSYSRRDNAQGRVTQLIERIKADFHDFAERELNPFFDTYEINGMEDWRHRILLGLKESRLLLACLSPAYIDSEYCGWEFNEYLKQEIGNACFGDGVAPIYFVEVPGWEDKDFEQKCAAWVTELRRRQHIDLRPWFHTGEEALREADVRERMQKLNAQLEERITRHERIEQSLGNVDAHNLHFIGRTSELRRLRETVALGRVGVLTAVHGLGGAGKTALAVEYAHAFAHEYGGGRWQVRCEDVDDLRAALASLQGARGLEFEFTDDEKRDPDRQFERVIRELKALADSQQPHLCLLILDNVDRPELLEPAQTKRLPAADWLHVLATTRLGENELFSRHKDRAFLPVDELPEAGALELVRSYQPGGSFADSFERDAALEIVNLLGRFTLAVETAAVYLGQYADDVSCSALLSRLKKEGLEGLDIAAGQTSGGVLHGEMRLSATLRPSLERLSKEEKLALSYAALFPADNIALPWIRFLVSKQFSEVGRDSEPGYPDPWRNLLRRLMSLRLLQPVGARDEGGQPLVARIHRLVQDVVNRRQAGDLIARMHWFIHDILIRRKAVKYVKDRAKYLWESWAHRCNRWEIESVKAFAYHLMEQNKKDGAFLANQLTRPLGLLGSFSEAKRLMERAIEINEQAFDPNHPTLAVSYSNLATVETDLGNLTEAKRLMQRAIEIDEQAFDPNHPTLAVKYSNLAMVEKDLGNFSEAKRLLQRAIEINEQAFESNHPNFAVTYSNLAAVELDLGNLTEAKRLMQRAIEIDEQAFDPNHPTLAVKYSNLAMVELDLGNPSEAKRLMERAIEIDEKAHAPNHHRLAIRYSNLAAVEKTLGNLTEAKRLLRRAIEIYEQAFDPNHPTLAVKYSNLAMVEKDLGNFSEAKRLLQRAIEINEQAFKPSHPTLAVRYSSLATVEKDLGNFTEAKHLLQRAIEINEQAFGRDHSKTLANLETLADLFEKTGEPDEALALRRLSILTQSENPDQPPLALRSTGASMLQNRRVLQGNRASRKSPGPRL